MSKEKGRVIPPYGDPRHIGAAITLEHVFVSYNGRRVLEDITATFCCGDRVAIVGPNGAGKTTLFKAIVGLIPIEQGHICLHGEDPDARTRLAYVPQREAIDWSFPVTVADVVLMGRYGRLGWFRRPGQRDREIAMESLALVGMEGYADAQIGELSGGQQQRVFLARALTQDADVLLLDEPFTGIDPATQQATLDLLERLQAQGKTVIVATHDLAAVKEHFEKVLALNRRVIAYGSTDEVLKPEVLAKTYGQRLTLLSVNGHHILAIGGLASPGTDSSV